MELPQSPQNGEIYQAAPSKYLQYDGTGWIRLKTNFTGEGYSRKLDQVKINEIPTGTIDGRNKVFRLQQIAIPGTDQLYYNGLLCKSGEINDYTLLEDIIIFKDAPEIGTSLSCTYSYSNLLEVINEVPTIDELNKNSVLLNYVPEHETIRIYVNGILQKIDDDFSINLNKIKFNGDLDDTDLIIANYFYIS
jgi:hypothetical protein